MSPDQPAPFDPMTFDPSSRLSPEHLAEIVTIASALALVDSLRGLVSQLQQRNAILESQVTALSARPAAPIVMSDDPPADAAAPTQDRG